MQQSAIPKTTTGRTAQSGAAERSTPVSEHRRSIPLPIESCCMEVPAVGRELVGRTCSFAHQLPLRVTSSHRKQLPARLEAARQVYSACLGEGLKRLGLLRQSKAYRAAQKMPRGKTGKGASQKQRAMAKARARAFREANAAVGFREYDLHAYATQFNHCWIGEHMDINTIEKLATRAFKAVQRYGFGKRGRPRFKGKNQMDSVEGKSNAFGIRWRELRVEWLGLKLEAIVDQNDPVIAHGLASRVKYARIVRRKIKGRNRFYVQLVCEGKPYQKPKNQLGEGDVGLDLGPSTVAAVAEQEAFLAQFRGGDPRGGGLDRTK